MRSNRWTRRLGITAAALIFAPLVAVGCQHATPVEPTPIADSAVDSDSHAGGEKSGITLVEVMGGTTSTSNNYPGQSVTIPGHGAHNHLQFNWYNSAQEPVAFGRLYILAQEYLGSPADLNPATPGVIARSLAIENGEYVIGQSVVLRAGQKYWFYADAQGAFVHSFDSSTYPDGDMYIVGMPALPFHRAQSAPGVFIDANFRLQARQ